MSAQLSGWTSTLPRCPPPSPCVRGCRDPQHFGCILTFLRDGRVPIPAGPLERQQLRAEASFYALVRPGAAGSGAATCAVAAGPCGASAGPGTACASTCPSPSRALTLNACSLPPRLQTELVAAIDELEAARLEAEAAAAAERQRQEAAARARDLLDSHRADVLQSVAAAVARDTAAEAQARQRHEAAQAALQQWEAAERQAAEQLHGLLPNGPEAVALAQQLQQHRAQMQPVRDAVRRARERLEKAGSKARLARLAQLCALGADTRAADLMEQVWGAPARQQQQQQQP